MNDTNAQRRDLQSARAALEESERRFALMMQHLPGFAWLKDRDGRYVFVSERTASHYGLVPGELLGRTDDQLFPEAIARLYRESDRRVMETGAPLRVMQSLPGEDGTLGFLVTTFPVADGGGGWAGTGGIALDVTEKKRTEDALEESRKRLQALFDNALDAILLADDDARYVDANAAACKLLGWSLDEIRKKTVRDLTPEPNHGLFSDLWRSFIDAGESRGEYAILRRDGTVVDTEFRAVANIVPGLHLSILRDITERKRAEAEREALVRELTEQRREFEALSRRLMTAQETERLHIARELHDEIGQLLTGLKLTLESATRLPAEASAQPLEKALAVVSELIATVRAMSLDLVPPELEEIGLAETLKWYVDRYTDQTGVKVLFEQWGTRDPIAYGTAIAAYRIVQEALTNVARHAGVKVAMVRLKIADGILEVGVDDRGRGFDPQEVSARKASSGLANMRERARLLGGEWLVRSSPGAGTCVSAHFPAVATGDSRVAGRNPEPTG